MPTKDKMLSFTRFIRVVRHRMRRANSDDVEALSVAVLTENPNRSYLMFQREPPTGDVEQRIFDALVSSKQINGLSLFHPFDLNSHGDMVQNALSKMPSLGRIYIGTRTTEQDAEAIFSSLTTRTSVGTITLYLKVTTNGIAGPLGRYLQESTSLRTLRLSWVGPDDGDGIPVTFSQDAMAAIFDGVRASKSLTTVTVEVPPSGDAADVVAKLLADAASNSTRLKGIFTVLKHEEFWTKMRDALVRTKSVRNFDMCFTRHVHRNYVGLVISRRIPFKPLLTRSVPLALWPRILSRRTVLKPGGSHGPPDIIYYFLKEKNDVLLQNVRSRKIRKRKHSQMS